MRKSKTSRAVGCMHVGGSATGSGKPHAHHGQVVGEPKQWLGPRNAHAIPVMRMLAEKQHCVCWTVRIVLAAPCWSVLSSKGMTKPLPMPSYRDCVRLVSSTTKNTPDQWFGIAQGECWESAARCLSCRGSMSTVHSHSKWSAKRVMPVYSSMRLGSWGAASPREPRDLICKSDADGSGLPAGAKAIVPTSCAKCSIACLTTKHDLHAVECPVWLCPIADVPKLG